MVDVFTDLLNAATGPQSSLAFTRGHPAEVFREDPRHHDRALPDTRRPLPERRAAAADRGGPDPDDGRDRRGRGRPLPGRARPRRPGRAGPDLTRLHPEPGEAAAGG